MDNEVVFEYTGDGCSVPNDITRVIFKEGLQKIGNYAFRDCTSLKSITLPSTVVEIGQHAFRGCNNLGQVVLNDGLKKIGCAAFAYCHSLQSITIPSTVEEIDMGAFEGCTNMMQATIVNYDKWYKIGMNAFVRCPSLNRFKFPRLSIRLDNIIRAGQRDIESKMDDIREVEWRDGELILPNVHRLYIGNPPVRRERSTVVNHIKLKKD